MAIKHAFGVARRARGIAQRAGLILIDCRPLVAVGLGGDKRLVAEDIGERCFRHVLSGRHDHPTFDARALIRHLLYQRPKVGVQKDVLIFGVIDNVNNLLGE